MVMANTLGLTGDFTMENTIKMKNMGTDYTSGLMANHTRVTGRMVFAMDKVSSVIKKGKAGLGFGLKEIVRNGFLQA